MENKEILTLMYKDFEVLSFEVKFGERNEIKVLEKLDRFDLAPYGMGKDKEEDNRILFKFFNARIIASQRYDYEEILKNTNSRDAFELSFKGHGLSLSNHYWFKKEGENLKYIDINFFTNKWDDTFGRAILEGDYEKLKTCDLNVPDIVTQGWSAKAWIYDNGPKLYKLGIVKDHYEDCLGEVLCSRLARRILKENEVVDYQLKQVGDRYASVCSPMIGIDEALVPLSDVLPRFLYELYFSKNQNKELQKKFFVEVKKYGLPFLYDFFVKLACIRSVCFVSDLHFDNISLIRNLKTKEYRIAPLYDLAGAFGTSKTGREFLSNITKGSYMIIYFLFGCLDSSWDYSWYDPSKLDGFEKEIKEVLSKSDFYDDELIEKIIAVYHQQKASLDENAKK